MSKNITIIGAGPGGLACAMMLAKSGVSVKIIERLPHVGGRTSTMPLGDYRFDLGPTFFLYPRVLEEIFRFVGKDLHSEIEMVRLDPQYHIVFGGGGDLQATPDLQQMAKEVAKISPSDSLNVQRFIDDNRDKLTQFRYCLEKPFNGIKDLFDLKLMGMLPIVRPWLSLDQELKRYFTDPRIRLAFSFQSKYLGMSPYNCPSLFSILSYLEYDYGVFHPIGGCGAVSEAMARVARELGVEICLEEEVEEILFQGRKATGVRTNKGTHSCDAMVINADFARAMSRLVPDHLRRRWTDKKLAKKKYSCSTFMLYLGVEGTYDEIAHHTIYIAKEYEKNLAEIEKSHTLSKDPSFYVQNACVTDSSLAPAGHSALYVLAPVTHQHANIDWEVEKQSFRQVVLKQLEKIGIRDIEQRIRVEKMVTPADWENQYEIYRGATFNLAHNLTQMLHMRPRNRFEDLQDVYLVGGGTHPGSGLPVIYESARITSKLLLDDFQIPTDWRVDNLQPIMSRPVLAEV